MAAEDAEALGASSRPGSAAATSSSGFVKVPSYKLPKFHATRAKEGGGGSSSGSKRSSCRGGGGDAASASGATAAAAGLSSSAPVAPASAFGSGNARNVSDGDDGSPRASGVAQPAVLPEAPPPESLPNPQRLGFFAAVKRSMSRVVSLSSAEREVEGGDV
jgi:hypothetical protein